MPPDHPCEKTQAKENNRHFAPLIAKKLVYLHRLVRPKRLHAGQPAEIAQLVEHPLTALEWWNGRHEGLKIPWPVMAVRVRVPLRAHGNARRPKGLPGVSCLSSLGLARRPTTGMRAPKPRINRQARRRPDRAPGCRHSRPAPACGPSPQNPAVRVPHATCRRCPPSCDCHRRGAGGRA